MRSPRLKLNLWAAILLCLPMVVGQKSLLCQENTPVGFLFRTGSVAETVVFERFVSGGFLLAGPKAARVTLTCPPCSGRHRAAKDGPGGAERCPPAQYEFAQRSFYNVADIASAAQAAATVRRKSRLGGGVSQVARQKAMAGGRECGLQIAPQPTRRCQSREFRPQWPRICRPLP